MVTRRAKVGCGFFLTACLAIGLVSWLGIKWWIAQPLYNVGDVRSEKRLRSPLQPPIQSKPNRWAVESDISLHFEPVGEGPPILIIHGGPGIPYATSWQGLEDLEDQFTFYYYHQRGSGRSTRPFDRFEGGNFYENMIELETTLGLGAQIADIERIRRILGEEKVILVGHSFGGFLATLYAAEFPNCVDRLILIAPAGVLTPATEERDLFANARKEIPQDDQPAYDKLLDEYLDFGDIFRHSDDELASRHMAMGEYLLQALGYDPEQFKDAPDSGGWSVFAMYFSMGTDYDYYASLEAITAPTLILHGADDTISRAGTNSYSSISNSRFVTVESKDSESRAGHFIFDECPEEFAAVITPFLQESTLWSDE